MSTQGRAHRDDIAEDVAEELGVPVSKVREAADYQFKYTRKVMEDGSFESIRLPYFGLFHVKDGRLEALNKDD